MLRPEIRIIYCIQTAGELRVSTDTTMQDEEKLLGVFTFKTEDGLPDPRSIKGVVFTNEGTQIIDWKGNDSTSHQDAELGIQAIRESLTELSLSGVLSAGDVRRMGKEMIREEVIKAITPPKKPRKWFGRR